MAMRRASIHVTSRPLRYHPETIVAQDGSSQRVLVPREKGIDLRLAFDLVSMARTGYERLDIDRIVGMFDRYLELSDRAISRAQAQERMFAKLAHPRLWLDLRPLLSSARAEALAAASTAESFRRVFSSLVDRLPGEPWAARRP